MHNIFFSEETWKQPGRPLELILNLEIKVFLIKNYEASTSAVLLQSLDLDSALKRWELFCIIIFPTNVKGIKALWLIEKIIVVLVLIFSESELYDRKMISFLKEDMLEVKEMVNNIKKHFRSNVTSMMLCLCKNKILSESQALLQIIDICFYGNLLRYQWFPIRRGPTTKIGWPKQKWIC